MTINANVSGGTVAVSVGGGNTVSVSAGSSGTVSVATPSASPMPVAVGQAQPVAAVVTGGMGPAGAPGPQGEPGPAGPPNRLLDLLDVELQTVGGGDVLRYDSGKWRNFSELGLTDGGNF